MAKEEEKKETERPFNRYIPDETVEHMRAARQEMRESIKNLLPDGFWEHRRAARKEMLLAVRGMIDAALARNEERSSKA